jgi:hypothetical protein
VHPNRTSYEVEVYLHLFSTSALIELSGKLIAPEAILARRETLADEYEAGKAPEPVWIDIKEQYASAGNLSRISHLSSP